MRFFYLSTLFAAALAAPSDPLINANPKIILGNTVNNLLSAGVIVNALSSQTCSPQQTLAISQPLFGLGANICLCVNVGPAGGLVNGLLGGLFQGSKTPCAVCPANSSQICASSGCACQCNGGFYSSTVNGKQTCIAQANCASPSILTLLSTGSSSCTCGGNLVSDLLGGCVNPGNVNVL